MIIFCIIIIIIIIIVIIIIIIIMIIMYSCSSSTCNLLSCPIVEHTVPLRNKLVGTDFSCSVGQCHVGRDTSTLSTFQKMIDD